MEMRQKQAIEAFQRVQDFLDGHPVAPPASYAGPRQLLDEVVARLTGHTVNQSAGGRQGRAETQRQRALVARLCDLHLGPIAKIARAQLAEAPGIQAALRQPSRRLPVTRLITEALAMRVSVTAYEPVFVSNGRPGDFLERLDAAVEALRASLVGRARSIGTKVGARQGIRQEIRRGMNAVQMLDAIVTTSFAGDLNTLGKWRTARRHHRVPGGSGSTTNGGGDAGGVPTLQAA